VRKRLIVNNVDGLRVTVEGDLPREVLERIGDAVRTTVLQEVAELDVAPALHEVPLEAADFADLSDVSEDPGDPTPLDIPVLLGIWFKRQDESQL
jgi:hypothetical protein